MSHLKLFGGLALVGASNLAQCCLRYRQATRDGDRVLLRPLRWRVIGHGVFLLCFLAVLSDVGTESRALEAVILAGWAVGIALVWRGRSWELSVLRERAAAQQRPSAPSEPG